MAVVRRVAPILLILAIWANCSGLMFLLHQREHHDALVPHDESRCQVCAARHAPVIQASVAAPVILLPLHPQPAIEFIPSLVSQRTPLTTACRGPPGC